MLHRIETSVGRGLGAGHTRGPEPAPGAGRVRRALDDGRGRGLHDPPDGPWRSRPTVRGTILGTLVAVAARFLCHFVSGVVFFASYAPEGWNPAFYSAAYNAAYLVPSLAIAFVVVVVVLRALENAQPSARQARYKKPAVT